MRGNYSKLRLRHAGAVWIAGTPTGICRLALGIGEKDFLQSLPKGIEWAVNGRAFLKIKKKLEDYLDGRSKSFTEKLDLRGTEFELLVWKKIAAVPRGETRSYAWLARAADRPRAFRAAANACGKNPVPLIIPCHRIIASDGTIGGFSSGINLKKRLLKIEKLTIGF